MIYTKTIRLFALDFSDLISMSSDTEISSRNLMNKILKKPVTLPTSLDEKPVNSAKAIYANKKEMTTDVLK